MADSAGSVPWWEDQPQLWDTITIAGKALPGLATVTGEVERKVKNDITPGKDGTTFNHLGYAGAQVKVKLLLWTAQHLADWIAIAQTLRPRKGDDAKDPPAVAVYHPALETLAIRSLYVLKLGVPQKGSTPGTYEVDLDFTEFIREAQRKSRVGKGRTARGRKKGGKPGLLPDNGGDLGSGTALPPSITGAGP